MQCHPKVHVAAGDAFRWRIPRAARWDVAFHDIWSPSAMDNLAEMDEIEARFADRVGWQSCWARDRCERRARKLRALRSYSEIMTDYIPGPTRQQLARWFYFANGGPAHSDWRETA